MAVATAATNGHRLSTREALSIHDAERRVSEVRMLEIAIEVRAGSKDISALFSMVAGYGKEAYVNAVAASGNKTLLAMADGDGVTLAHRIAEHGAYCPDVFDRGRMVLSSGLLTDPDVLEYATRRGKKVKTILRDNERTLRRMYGGLLIEPDKMAAGLQEKRAALLALLERE